MTHPNRPQHHDFTRLSAVVIEADDQSDAGKGVPETVGSVIDLNSALYMAEGRAKLMASLSGTPHLMPNMRAMLITVWLDALRAGIRFQQEGGHE